MDSWKKRKRRKELISFARRGAVYLIKIPSIPGQIAICPVAPCLRHILIARRGRNFLGVNTGRGLHGCSDSNRRRESNQLGKVLFIDPTLSRLYVYCEKLLDRECM